MNGRQIGAGSAKSAFDATAPMALTLGKVKTVKWMSEETVCYSATILIDGVLKGSIQNDGHGGCDLPSFGDFALQQELDRRCKVWAINNVPWVMKEPRLMDYSSGLGVVCGHLRDLGEVSKSLVRARKSGKVCFLMPGENVMEGYRTIKCKTAGVFDASAGEAWVRKNRPTATIVTEAGLNLSAYLYPVAEVAAPTQQEGGGA